MSASVPELSRYELLDVAGEGRMGRVWRARQRSMDRIVAVKILRSSFAERPLYVERFYTEARYGGQLHHPNLLQIHEVAEEAGRHFFAMEFVAGDNLRQLLLEHGPLDEEAGIDCMLQVASALLAVHAHGLVHRDVKPENVLLDRDGLAKLADLGLARPVGEADPVKGKVQGSPAYVAPEQVLGEALDERTDLYGLGASLFHLLTGELLYEGADPQAIFRQHLEATPRPLRELRPDCSPELEQIIGRCLEKQRERRYADARELLVDLHALVMGRPLPSANRRKPSGLFWRR